MAGLVGGPKEINQFEMYIGSLVGMQVCSGKVVK